MIRRSGTIRSLPLLLALLGGGIHLPPGSLSAADPITVTDFRGRQITLAQPAERIICLLESALTGLYMLGAEDRLVGVSTNVYQGTVFSYYAAMDERVRRKSLPTPGNWDFVNIESMVALQPDLVVVWAGQEESIQALEEKGIPVFGVQIDRFEDIHREILALGAVTATTPRAEELIGYARGELEAVRGRVAAPAGTERPRVYFMWAQGPLETSGRDSTVEELIALAGGVNVAGGSGLEHLVVNLEVLLIWNPEVIVMWWNDRQDPAHIMQMASWRSLAAVRSGRVHELPDPFSCDFWTLKYIFTVEMVARWCYPERFAGSDDLDPLRVELLQKLYGDKLPAAALSSLAPEPEETR